MTETARTRVAASFRESAALFETLAAGFVEPVARAADLVHDALVAGGTLLICGNGGSAADAQHIAAELGAKFYRKRPGLPAVALTVNSSMLTAIGNDFAYDEVFSRQVEALGRPGDVLLAISTSGNSGNVVEAARAARAMGITVIGLTGASGGKLEPHCHLLLAVPSTDTPRIQEGHIAIGHLVCELVETRLFPPGEERPRPGLPPAGPTATGAGPGPGGGASS
jgi:D-sedoheptulose 7-phosphate isomerase